MVLDGICGVIWVKDVRNRFGVGGGEEVHPRIPPGAYKRRVRLSSDSFMRAKGRWTDPFHVFF